MPPKNEFVLNDKSVADEKLRVEGQSTQFSLPRRVQDLHLDPGTKGLV